MLDDIMPPMSSRLRVLCGGSPVSETIVVVDGVVAKQKTCFREYAQAKGPPRVDQSRGESAIISRISTTREIGVCGALGRKTVDLRSRV